MYKNIVFIFFMGSSTVFCVKNELFDLEERVRAHCNSKKKHSMLKNELLVLKIRSNDPFSPECKSQMSLIKDLSPDAYDIITKNVTWQLLRTFGFEEQVLESDKNWEAGNITDEKWKSEKKKAHQEYRRKIDADPERNKVKENHMRQLAIQEACEAFEKYLQ